MPVVGPDPDTMNDLTEFELECLRAYQFYQDHDSGYSKQQSTRPQTLATGCRLAYRASRMDSREVLSMDGLQRAT